MSLFQKATKEFAFARIVPIGPPGSGKTVSSLKAAQAFGSRVALIDTERGSSRKYSNEFDFDVVEVLDPAIQKQLPKPGFHPENATYLMEMAAQDHDVVILDSGSHFWNGTGGFLELVDDEVKRMSASGRKGDSFAAWKAIDPIYRKFVNSILNLPAHCFICLRAKTSYEKKDGKVIKLGMEPEMRDGFIYEADVECMLDMEHNLVIGKTRIPALDGRIFNKPGKEFGQIIMDWLRDGAKPVAKPSHVDMPKTQATFSMTDRINNCNTVAALESLLESDIRKLPPDEQKSLVPIYRDRKAFLQQGGTVDQAT